MLRRFLFLHIVSLPRFDGHSSTYGVYLSSVLAVHCAAYLCALFCCLRLMTSPTTNLISLPFSHLTCDLHDVKRFLFRATSPKSRALNFYSGVEGAIFGGQQ